MLRSGIEEIRIESVKLEERRKALEERVSKLQGKSKMLVDEEKFLTMQIESNAWCKISLEAESARRVLREGIANLELLKKQKEDEVANVSQVSIKKIKISTLKEHKRSRTVVKQPPTNNQKDFRLAKERYEKRIELIERRLSQLRNGNNSPISRYKAVREINEIEKVFFDSVSSVREEILRRKVKSSEERSTFLKVSKSLPKISLRKDIVLNPSIISFKDFTETDKMYSRKQIVVRHLKGFCMM
eukprot:TRINITY_DN14524_c0_g2_i14.p2 TRINITY_DN14524_c0_g2~~TRINITY_DN14524_c0_g2_i14.p2  ORF type:complete len:244 (-),score=28.20 TRINITY_DN14524_c0_g2_i14:130-861(-)